MQNEKRWISSKILFSLVAEELADNRKASFTVTGMSMWPFLCHGRDQVIVEKVSENNLKKGDIILLQISQERYLLHRITALRKEFFQTTGDSNLYRDIERPYDCIVARVCQVVRNGKKIDCKNLYWKVLSRIWMCLFPVRRWCIRGWMKIRKYIKE